VAWFGGHRAALSSRARWRASAALTARGEFSIVIASLGVEAGAPPRLSAIAAGYVLLTAIVGPLAAKLTTRLPPSPAPTQP